jgi:hypothetical protein
VRASSSGTGAALAPPNSVDKRVSSELLREALDQLFTAANLNLRAATSKIVASGPHAAPTLVNASTDLALIDRTIDELASSTKGAFDDFLLSDGFLTALDAAADEVGTPDKSLDSGLVAFSMRRSVRNHAPGAGDHCNAAQQYAVAVGFGTVHVGHATTIDTVPIGNSGNPANTEGGSGLAFPATPMFEEFQQLFHA